jgi:hypothetical protein
VLRHSNTLHLVLSLSAPGLLRQALRQAGLRENVVGFTDCLAIGPINPPAPRRRARWLASTLHHGWSGDWNWLPQSVYGFWREARQPGRRRIVWTSSRSANQHAAFLACVERFGDEPYEVIDLADVEVEIRFDDGRRRREKALSLSMLGPETIVRENLWRLARPLSTAERAAALEQWRQLKAEDAPLRVLGPQGLRSASVDHFDATLLSHATSSWQPAPRIIGYTMADEMDDGYLQTGDPFLFSRLSALIQDGRLEARPRPLEGKGGKVEDLPFPLRTEVRLRCDARET